MYGDNFATFAEGGQTVAPPTGAGSLVDAGMWATASHPRVLVVPTTETVGQVLAFSPTQGTWAPLFVVLGIVVLSGMAIHYTHVEKRAWRKRYTLRRRAA